MESHKCDTVGCEQPGRFCLVIRRRIQKCEKHREKGMVPITAICAIAGCASMAKDGMSQYCGRHTIEMATTPDTKRDRETDFTFLGEKSSVIDEIVDDDFDVLPPANKKPNLVYSTHDIHAVDSPSKVKPLRIIIAPVTYRSPKAAASSAASGAASGFASCSASCSAPKLDIGPVVDEPRQTFTIEVDRQFVLTCAKIAKHLSAPSTDK